MQLIHSKVFSISFLLLVASSTAPILAQEDLFQPLMVKRKYFGDVRFHSKFMAVIIEPTIYEMYQNQDLKDPKVQKAWSMIPDPLVEIMDDFSYLEASKLPLDPKMAEKWGLKDTSSGSWLEWYGDRVKLITGDDPAEDVFWTQRFSDEWRSPVTYDSAIPEGEGHSVHLTDPKEKAIPLAGNYVGQILHRVREQKFSYRYKSTHFPEVVSGADFGVIRLYPDYFNLFLLRVGDKKSDRYLKPSYATKVIRNSIMMHEARHSDGVKGSILFIHSICPEGHPFKLIKACDRSQNGPISVEADFLKLYLDACNTPSKNKVCANSEIDLMKGKLLNARGFVLDEKIYPKDGEGKMVTETLDDRRMIFNGIPKNSIKRGN